MSERTKKARELFVCGYNCSPAVVGAYSDLFGMEPEAAMKFAEGLGGGMGRMRLTCGAVAAMSLVAGLKMSSGKPGNQQERAKIYGVVRNMADEFTQKNGTIICGELLDPETIKDKGSVPEARTEQYYKKRPCADCVTDCAEIIEKYLL